MSHTTTIIKTLLCILLLTNGVTRTQGQQYKLDTIVFNGDPGKFINLVFLGDGFQTAELPAYLENARKLSNYLFSISPFTEYRNFFNVFAISVASPESGANHPGTATDESSSNNQPVVTVNTTFNSTFDYAAIHRLLVPQNYTEIFNVLTNNAPFYDEIFMLVNSPYYGGSGSLNLATSSLNTNSYEVLVHEIGHSFAELADEYYAGDVYANEVANMTQESNPTLVRWKEWIGVDGVGVYQHCCGGNSAQWYKPHQGCKMQSLGSLFCPVCREEIIKKIYDFVPALDSFLPLSQNAIDYCAGAAKFKLQINKPAPNTVKVTWRLNGTVIAANVDSLTIHASQLNDNNNILSAVVVDTTAMIRSVTHLINHSDTVTWTINNSSKVPALTATGPTNFCEGNGVTLRSDVTVGNRWYKDGVLINDSTAATFVARESGSYFVKTKVNDCESVASNVIIVTATSNPAPVVTPSSGSSCSGQSIELRTVSATGKTYQWKRAGINITGATGPSYTAAVSGIYTLLVSDTNGCTASSNEVNITIGTAPQAAIAAAGPTSFCTGKSVLLKATLGTGYRYQWRKSGALIAGATSSTYIADGTGVFTVQVTNAEGCSSTSPATSVIANPVPVATAVSGGSLTFCAGKSLLLRATQGTGYTYQWKKNGISLEGETSPNFTATTTGIYSVEVTNSFGCSATSSSFNVTVNAIPIATITPNGSLTFCTGKNVILRASSGTGYLYQWKRGGTIITGASGFTYTATTTGAYSVIITNASGCIVTSAPTVVVVNPLPTATITPAGSISICAGKNVLLKANTGTAYTYQWKRAGINIPDNSTGVNYTASVSGVYSVAVTNSYGCTVTSSATTVTVNNPPVASVASSGPTTLCVGRNVLLKTTVGTGYSYQWQKSGAIIAGAVSSTYIANATGIYTVRTTDAKGCSTTSTPTNVTVNPVPVATAVAGGILTFCAGKSVLLRATQGTGYTYQWKKNGISLEGETSPNFTGTTTGIYSVEVTNSFGCSATSSSFNVTVNAIPIATITPNGPLTFCTGRNVILRASSGTGYLYQWKRGGTIITGASGFTYTATTTGAYSVIITNASGCIVTSAPTVVVVNPLPTATITPAGSISICAGKNVLLKANTGTAYTYQWKRAGINIPGNSTGVNYTASVSGVYSVAVTNSYGCTVTSSATTVTVNNPPVVTITPSGPLTIPRGGNVLLNAPTGTGYSYQWKKDGVNISGAVFAIYSATLSGNYSVTVTAPNLCEATSQQVLVTVTSEKAITKSNMFLRVYPNPVVRGEFLNIDRNLDNANHVLKITVTDVAGRLVWSRLLKPGEKQMLIPGKAGVYFVEIIGGQYARTVYKIIKIE